MPPVLLLQRVPEAWKTPRSYPQACCSSQQPAHPLAGGGPSLRSALLIAALQAPAREDGTAPLAPRASTARAGGPPHQFLLPLPPPLLQLYGDMHAGWPAAAVHPGEGSACEQQGLPWTPLGSQRPIPQVQGQQGTWG